LGFEIINSAGGGRSEVEVNVMSDPAARQRPMINLDEFERRLNRSVAPARNGEDPLAELARLVGDTEDRYKSVFQPRPVAPAPRPAAPAARSPAPSAPRFTAATTAERPRVSEPIMRPRRLGGDFAAIEAGLRSTEAGLRDRETSWRGDEANLRGTYAPEFHAPPPPEPDAEGEDWLNAPYLPPPPAAIEAPRSRLPLYATAAIIVIGMTGIGASFALKRHSVAPHEIATIKADQAPIKIQAADTGDTMKPEENTAVLDNASQSTPVKVSTASEEPKDLGTVPPPSPTPTQAAPATGVPVPTPPAAEGQGQTFGLAGMIEPKKVKTVDVRPDGTIVSSSSDDAPTGALPAAAPPSAPPSQQVSDMAPVGPGPVQVDPAVAPKATDRAVSDPSPNADAAASPHTDAATPVNAADDDAAPPVGKPAAHVVHAKPLAVAEADSEAGDAAPQSGRAASFAVQLAAPGSEREARQSLVKFQKEYGSEISGYRLKYHLAKVADKTVYRVRVVGLSHEEATALCQKLQAKGGSCFVARN
jgi:SPOR domain